LRREQRWAERGRRLGIRARRAGGELAGLRELGPWRDGNPNDYDDDDDGIDDAG